MNARTSAIREAAIDAYGLMWLAGPEQGTGERRALIEAARARLRDTLNLDDRREGIRRARAAHPNATEAEMGSGDL